VFSSGRKVHWIKRKKEEAASGMRSLISNRSIRVAHIPSPRGERIPLDQE